MKRIMLMVLRNLLFAPYWFIQVCWYGSHLERYSEEQRFALLKKVTIHANKGGRVKIEPHGLENLPEKNGFILYPNHQGMYDVLSFLECCPRPFSVVMKKELVKVPFLKQIFRVMEAIPMDRDDLKQSMRVILQVAQEVKEGRNYLIFAEGTRSRDGNHLLPFKGGSFKSAVRAQCPIVPVAIMNSYLPFDTNSIKKVTVPVYFLPPLYYDDYKNLKTTEIAEIVREKIEKAIDKAGYN
ncbi:lysophospholipid acyltransferase family protein [Diplocloster hominis]|uniref:lysophospholipid acyltransferase family protein n=1 Tax=Diplocloster hominis TaxID=3079010 RepID=UPI0031BABBA1